MNRELVLELADRIEGIPPQKFSMGSYVSTVWGGSTLAATDTWERIERDCETAACVAGWAVAHAHVTRPDHPALRELKRRHVSFETGAANLLEIGRDTQIALFRPDGFDNPNLEKTFTPKRAAAVLRHFAETGVVEWHRFAVDGTDIEAK